MEKVVDAVVGLRALRVIFVLFCLFGWSAGGITRVPVPFEFLCSIYLTGDATNRKTVRLIAAVLRPDVGAVEAQVPSVGA